MAVTWNIHLLANAKYLTGVLLFWGAEKQGGAF